MIRITENSLTIHIEHPCPKEVLIDIRQSLLTGLQQMNHEGIDEEKLKDTYFFLLLLIKETMEEELNIKKGD